MHLCRRAPTSTGLCQCLSSEQHGACPGGGLPTWSRTFNFSKQFCEVVGYYNISTSQMRKWNLGEVGLCLRLHSQKGTGHLVSQILIVLSLFCVTTAKLTLYCAETSWTLKHWSKRDNTQQTQFHPAFL